MVSDRTETPARAEASTEAPLVNKRLYRVNVGCGQTPTAGWTNFDNSPSLRLARHPLLARMLLTLGLLNRHQWANVQFCRANRIEWADGCKRIPLPDAAAEVLYTSHMLEHLDRSEAERFLQEARRVLALGGIIRVAVPDLERMVRQYLDSANADELLERMQVTASRPHTLAAKLLYLIVGPRHHLWMYDGPSLVRLLTSCGFENAKVTSPGQSCIRDAGALDLRERESDSVYVEARR
jgi:hypothetical protein